MNKMEIVKCCFEPVEMPEFIGEFIETAYSKCTDPKCKFYSFHGTFTKNIIIFISYDTLLIYN